MTPSVWVGRTLALPRLAKRLVAVSVDMSLCVLTVWLAFYLRLGEWVPMLGHPQWQPMSAALLLTLVRHGGRRGLLGGPVGLGVLLARRGAGGGPRGCNKRAGGASASLSGAGNGVWRPQRAHAFAPLT